MHCDREHPPCLELNNSRDARPEQASCESETRDSSVALQTPSANISSRVTGQTPSLSSSGVTIAISGQRSVLYIWKLRASALVASDASDAKTDLKHAPFFSGGSRTASRHFRYWALSRDSRAITPSCARTRSTIFMSAALHRVSRCLSFESLSLWGTMSRVYQVRKMFEFVPRAL